MPVGCFFSKAWKGIKSTLRIYWRLCWVHMG